MQASSPQSISAEWERIIATQNISAQFARNLQGSSRENQNLIGMRLDERSRQLIDRPFAPKPSTVKLKTGNWGWMKESIPVDQTNLAKSINGHIKPGTSTELTRNPQKYPNVIAITTKKISLQEITEGLARGEYKEVKSSNPNRIYVKPVGGSTPEDASIIFSIDLKGPKQKIEAKLTPQVAQPDWWKANWGDFNAAQQFEYNAQYRKNDLVEFRDLEIFGAPVNGKVCAFGKDNDGFLPCVQQQIFNDLPAAAKKIINTFYDLIYAS